MSWLPSATRMCRSAGWSDLQFAALVGGKGQNRSPGHDQSSASYNHCRRVGYHVVGMLRVYAQRLAEEQRQTS